MSMSYKIHAKKRRPNGIISRLVALVFYLSGPAIIAAIAFGLPWWHTRQAQSWIQAPCRILSIKLVDYPRRFSTYYNIDVVYRYQLDGRNYDSNRYDFTFGNSTARQWREAVIEANPPGKQTVCYVNPANPADSVLSRGYESFGNSIVSFLYISVGWAAFVQLVIIAIRMRTMSRNREAHIARRVDI